MKKASTLLFLLLISIGFVAASELPTVVTGHVYAEDGYTPLPGMDVSVTCNAVEKTNTTNSQGQYTVEFNVTEDCDIGDLVEVCVNEDVCESDYVTETPFWKNIVYINLQIPEFGIVAATVALAGAVAGFFLLRKKK